MTIIEIDNIFDDLLCHDDTSWWTLFLHDGVLNLLGLNFYNFFSNAMFSKYCDTSSSGPATVFKLFNMTFSVKQVGWTF